MQFTMVYLPEYEQEQCEPKDPLHHPIYLSLCPTSDVDAFYYQCTSTPKKW